MINFGVDAFRINFSHNTHNIKNIVSKIKLEVKAKKRIALIGDLQGIKLKNRKIKNDSAYIKKIKNLILI